MESEESSVACAFGAGEGFLTQNLFGAARRVGRSRADRGGAIGVLASEATHAGRRVRSWLYVGRVCDRGEAGTWAPGVDSPVDLHLCVHQASHHSRGGAVKEVLDLVRWLDATSDTARHAPASFWLGVGAAASVGLRVRRPSLQEMRVWRASR